jgi:restriction endonuclease S subunit
MRDGWVEATLRDALEPIAHRPEGKDYPLVLSVTEKRGIIPQTEIFNHRIATDDISKYKVLEPMDIAYNPYLLWCGAIGQWQGTEAGVVSPVYECFRVKSNCEPRYMGYIFETGILTNYFDALAIGSIVRRRRTIPSDFIAAPIQLPPRPEQKRIVDLISSVDTYIEALQQHLENIKNSRSALLHELLTAGGDDWVKNKLGEYINLNTGKLDVNAASEFGEYPFFTCSRETYRIDEAAFDGESVLVAGNGDLNVKYFDGKFNAYQRTYVLNSINKDILDNKFLFLFMQMYIDFLRSETRGSVIQYLKKGQFTEAKINIPPLSEQRRIVELTSTMTEATSQSELTLNEARNLRAGLLSDLLRGKHEIPTTYDKVMGTAS